MENNLNNRDFEQFVKQNADQYRMFPSEKVWENINSSLHTRKRWFSIGISLLLITTAAVTGVMILNPSQKQQANNSIKPAKASIQNNKLDQEKSGKIISPEQSILGTKTVNGANGNQQKILFLDLPSVGLNEEEDQSIANASENTVTSPELPQIALFQKENISKTVIVTNRTVTEKNNNHINFTQEKITNELPVVNEKYPETNSTSIEKKETKDLYPLTIESVVNFYKHSRIRKKLSWQVFITPTISYRELAENKVFINSAQFNSNGVSVFYSPDINSVVTHKPDIGLQLGFTTGYTLSKNIKIISGLQFNVSKYDIRAYRSTSEVTTIALRTPSGGTTSYSTVTNYRNTSGGSKANWLHNLYLSASAPLGVEMNLVNSKRSYFGVAGTVQPSYILTNRSYLISTDYKNYAEIPSLIRKWNINTGFELFVGNTKGDLKWRIGPHVRYQTMSSFKKKYPVQEHLFDFGLKLGVLLSK